MKGNLMLYLASMSLLLICIGFIVLNRVLQKMRKIIEIANSKEDIILFRCETVVKRKTVIMNIHRLFIIGLTVASLNYVVSSSLKIILAYKESDAGNMAISQLLLKNLCSTSFLILLSGLVAYAITKSMLRYYEVLVAKCRKLGVLEN